MLLWLLFFCLAVARNVVILGVLCAVFGVDPTLIIPINAALHALGGVIVSLMALSVFLYSGWNMLARWRTAA